MKADDQRLERNLNQANLIDASIQRVIADIEVWKYSDLAKSSAERIVLNKSVSIAIFLYQYR